MYIHDTGCTHNFAKKIFKAMNSEPVYELLRTVCKNLEASKKAYTDYLVNGKTFRFAQELKKYNTRIMELLSAKQGLLSSSLQQDAATLLAHYTSWIEKWNTLAAEMNPQPDDVFVFVNDITFSLMFFTPRLLMRFRAIGFLGNHYKKSKALREAIKN